MPKEGTHTHIHYDMSTFFLKISRRIATLKISFLQLPWVYSSFLFWLHSLEVGNEGNLVHLKAVSAG